MGEFPSGQRGQTVNLLAVLSVVRIHLPPPERRRHHKMTSSFWYGSSGRGFERRLLAACRWHAATAVAFPQKRDPTRSASSSRTTQVRDDFFMLRMKKSSLTCSTAPRFKIVTALLGHDFVFAAGTGRDFHEKSPSGRMGFFGAAARVGEDGAEIRRRSVYTDAAFWSRKSWMTSNRWTGSSCWVVQSFARRSTAARSSEKGEMTASVVQQPLCRCWPRRP